MHMYRLMGPAVFLNFFRTERGQACSAEVAVVACEIRAIITHIGIVLFEQLWLDI